MSRKRPRPPAGEQGEGALPLLDTPFGVERDHRGRRRDRGRRPDGRPRPAERGDQRRGRSIASRPTSTPATSCRPCCPASRARSCSTTTSRRRPSGRGSAVRRTGRPPTIRRRTSSRTSPIPKPTPSPCRSTTRRRISCPSRASNGAKTVDAGASGERRRPIREAPVIVAPTREARDLALFDPEPDPGEPPWPRRPATRPRPRPSPHARRPVGHLARHPRPRPSRRRSPRRVPRSRRKPHRPPGPMHRPIVRDAARRARAGRQGRSRGERTHGHLRAARGRAGATAGQADDPRGREPRQVVFPEPQSLHARARHRQRHRPDGHRRQPPTLPRRPPRRGFQARRSGQRQRHGAQRPAGHRVRTLRRRPHRPRQHHHRVPQRRAHAQPPARRHPRHRRGARHRSRPRPDADQPGARPAGPRIPWTWVGLWAAATFLAVLVVLVLVRRHSAESPERRLGTAARAHVDLAESAMRGARLETRRRGADRGPPTGSRARRAGPLRRSRRPHRARAGRPAARGRRPAQGRHRAAGRRAGAPARHRPGLRVLHRGPQPDRRAGHAGRGQPRTRATPLAPATGSLPASRGPGAPPPAAARSR